jgi:Small-conductance mechanosensitive channel
VTGAVGSATPSGVAGVARAVGVVLTVETPEPESFDLDIGLILGAAFTFTLAYIVARAAAVVLRNASELTVEHRIAIKSFIPVTRFAVYVVAVVVVVGPLFELTTSQLLAFSGALGAVLGLGIQNLFANVVGGFVVVFQRPYRPGDKIQIGEHYGEVTDVGIGSTTLLTVDDDEVLVPNYKFFTESVANANAGDAELMVVPEVYIAHGADIERGREILRDVMRSSRYVYVSDDHPLVVRVDHDPAYVTLRGRAYVNDVRREFAFESAVTRRTLAALDEEGIERPDPAIAPGGAE